MFALVAAVERLTGAAVAALLAVALVLAAIVAVVLLQPEALAEAVRQLLTVAYITTAVVVTLDFLLLNMQETNVVLVEQ